jgi:hypothetical protein
MFAFDKVFFKITYMDSESSFKNVVDGGNRVAGEIQVCVELKQITFEFELPCA